MAVLTSDRPRRRQKKAFQACVRKLQLVLIFARHEKWTQTRDAGVQIEQIKDELNLARNGETCGFISLDLEAVADVGTSHGDSESVDGAHDAALRRAATPPDASAQKAKSFVETAYSGAARTIVSAFVSCGRLDFLNALLDDYLRRYTSFSEVDCPRLHLPDDGEALWRWWRERRTIRWLQSLFNVGWFFEWPGGRQPANSTWPWSEVMPALLVLWGVCWMFMDSQAPYNWTCPSVDPVSEFFLQGTSLPDDFVWGFGDALSSHPAAWQAPYLSMPPGNAIHISPAAPGTRWLPSVPVSDSVAAPPTDHRPGKRPPSTPASRNPTAGYQDVQHLNSGRSQGTSQAERNSPAAQPYAVSLSPRNMSTAIIGGAASVAHLGPNRLGEKSSVSPQAANGVDAPINHPQLIPRPLHEALSSTNSSPLHSIHGVPYPSPSGTDLSPRSVQSRSNMADMNYSQYPPPDINMASMSGPYIEHVESEYPNAIDRPEFDPTADQHDQRQYPSPAPPPDNPYTTVAQDAAAQAIMSANHPRLDSLVEPKKDAELPSPGRSKPVPKPNREVKKNEKGRYYCDRPDCTEEVKDFQRKCEWSKHMDKHERPYKCGAPGCEKLPGFTYSGGLLRHEREVHNKHGGPRKQLNCPHATCKRHTGKGFSRQENLNEHLRRVHTDSAAAAQTADDTEGELDAAGNKRKRPRADADLREEMKRLRQENEELRQKADLQTAQTAEVLKQLQLMQANLNRMPAGPGQAPPQQIIAHLDMADGPR